MPDCANCNDVSIIFIITSPSGLILSICSICFETSHSMSQETFFKPITEVVLSKIIIDCKAAFIIDTNKGVTAPWINNVAFL